MYPHRHAVPQTVWRQHFAKAAREIDILTYSGLFLAEDTSVMLTMAQRAHAGVKVRVLLGDPDSPEVAARGIDEHIGPDIMAARTRNALALYQPLHHVPGVEVRLHSTVLYNSIYRVDDQIPVNTHAYGITAAQAPVTHLQTGEENGTAAVYLTSFERVWTSATPYPSKINTVNGPGVSPWVEATYLHVIKPPHDGRRAAGRSGRACGLSGPIPPGRPAAPSNAGRTAHSMFTSTTRDANAPNAARYL